MKKWQKIVQNIGIYFNSPKERTILLFQKLVWNIWTKNNKKRRVFKLSVASSILAKVGLLSGFWYFGVFSRHFCHFDGIDGDDDGYPWRFSNLEQCKLQCFWHTTVLHCWWAFQCCGMVHWTGAFSTQQLFTVSRCFKSLGSGGQGGQESIKMLANLSGSCTSKVNFTCFYRCSQVEICS